MHEDHWWGRKSFPLRAVPMIKEENLLGNLSLFLNIFHMHIRNDATNMNTLLFTWGHNERRSILYKCFKDKTIIFVVNYWQLILTKNKWIHMECKKCNKRSGPYRTCPENWISPLLVPIGVSGNFWMSSKQNTPWSDPCRILQRLILVYTVCTDS